METMSSGDEKHEKTCRIPNRKTSQEDLRHHPPTIEFLLKQVFSLHNKKIRELKTQIKELKSELQNALISNVNCLRCENERQNQQELTHHYEKLLQEKDQLIRQLIQEQKRLSNENGNQFNSSTSIYSQPSKKRKVNVSKCEMKARNICGTSGCSPDSVTSPEALDKSEITDDTALNKDGLQERVLSDKVDESSTAETEIQIVPETVLDEMDHNLGSPCNIVVPETISVDVEISETSPFFPLNNITDDSNHEVKTIKNVVSNLVFKPPSKPVRKRSNIKTSEAVIIPEKNTSNNRENSTEFFEIFASGRSKTDATYCETNDCNSKSLTTNSGMKKNETKNRCKRNTPTSSNCTISFEPLPPNYRKPKYKQMTLTQNIFFEFHDEGENGSSDPTTKPQRENDDHSNNPSKECNKERINEDVSNTSDRRGLQHNGNIDNLDYSGDDDSNLDCTYVPPHLIANSSVNTPGDDVSMSKINEKVDFRMRDADEMLDDTSSSSEDLLQEMLKSSPVKTVEIPNLALSNRLTNKSPEISLQDFDIVPERNACPNYKYKNDVVRKRDERRKLDGHKCYDCEAYFSALKLSKDEMCKRLKECSRHREKYPVPKTPEHFWSLDFPNNNDDHRNRDVLDATQHRPLRSRRLRK